MNRVGLTFNSNHHLHDSLMNGYPCPENPLRIKNIMEYLKNSGLIDDENCRFYDALPASVNDILRVHTQEYVELIRTCTKDPRQSPGNDVYVCPSSFDVVLEALGCVLKAGDLVVSGECRHAFAIVRPPGHHAGPDSCSGFCIFNNSGILARYLREVKGLERIAIINIDAHASDGTYDAFEADTNVLCVSMHQDQKTLYPFKGFIRDIGVRPALGYCINMEMPTESGNPEYSLFYDEVVEKVLDKFNPQIVILECGFDAYYKEPLAKLNLTVDGYYRIIFKLASKWDVVTLLEGGYHEDLGLLASVVLRALAGFENVKDDVDQIDLLASRHVKTRKEFNNNLSLLKSRLEPYWGPWNRS
ncbi:histone deacetylase family protein [Methanolobus bombayensis]|uniref:histone deacetylase family protein n=1 Tax=Methanolobus bombayensis TaxID=38023 RepID=UPI001AE586A2|nr:histone deacetylase [Methanolobus bombayensis]MBP1910246.1 acetoin utilization deacetylase AcuC-like enzyme [Methanolobus bombayensis]